MQLNMLLNTILIVTFLTFCLSYTCPDDDKTVEVNLTQFAGEWFVVAGVPITLKLGSCMHVEVTSSGHNFSWNHTVTSYRNNQRLLWKASGLQFDRQLNATWQLSTSKRVLGPFRHQVLSIDYGQYCAMVVCANDTTAIPKQIFAMIWSRNRTLSNDTLSDLKKEISTYVTREDILDVNNTCEGISF